MHQFIFTKFLAASTAAVLLLSGVPACRTAQPAGDAASAADSRAPYDQRIGVQTYSARNQLNEDLEGTLKTLAEMGFVTIEVHGGLLSKIEGDKKAFLDQYGFQVRSYHVGIQQLKEDLEGEIALVKSLGAEHVVVPWIPHEGETLTVAENDAAIDFFNEVGPKIKAAGLRFLYHPHGYEFQDGGSGSGKPLMDEMIERTEAGVVDFQMDVFWVANAGKDPLDYIKRYPGRFVTYHMKDMKEGTEVPRHDGKQDHEAQVTVGSGTIDYVSLVAEAEKQGALYYFIEDESSSVMDQLPGSLAYIKSIAP